MAKGSKRDVESISARVAKYASKKMAKAEVNLNCSLWIDYNNWLWIVLIVYLCLLHGRFSLFYINLHTGFMICFISCSTALRVRRAWNLMATSVRNGQKFFILFGKKYYFIQKLKFSYYNNLFGNAFQTSGV